MPKLILGSSSPYRRELLGRLRLGFSVDPPDIDETPKPGEDSRAYVERLARTKAQAVGARHPDALVIGCDQCADLEGTLIGKPLEHDAALAQLRNLSGHEVIFRTGVCLRNTSDGQEWYREIHHTVTYRSLEDEEIEEYLRIERPYNCTASFRSEGLGPVLAESIDGGEPSSLVGLPLATVAQMLRVAGMKIPGSAQN